MTCNNGGVSGGCHSFFYLGMGQSNSTVGARLPPKRCIPPLSDPGSAKAPWLPQMPVLEPESSIGERKNWRLTCVDEDQLKMYWKFFRHVYGSEMDYDGIPKWYNTISPEYMMGQIAPRYYAVIFRTKGTPSFAPRPAPSPPTQEG